MKRCPLFITHLSRESSWQCWRVRPEAPSPTPRLVPQRRAKLGASSWQSTAKISAQPQQHLSCKCHPLRRLEQSRGSGVISYSPSNCRIIPWPLKGSRTPLIPNRSPVSLAGCCMQHHSLHIALPALEASPHH